MNAISYNVAALLASLPVDDPAPRTGILHEPAESYYRRVLGEANKSGLDRMGRSPAHYRAYCEGQDDPPTPAMIFGKAFHAYVLEPQKFASEFAVSPDFGPMQSSTNRAKRAEWLAERPGLTLISQDDLDTIQRMADAVMRHELACNLITGGHREISVRWSDAETGIACKARVDYYLPELNIAFDLKTTDDASPEAFSRSVAKYRYHVQAAHYMDGFKAVGAPLRQFLFVAVEKEAPYGVSVCYCDDAALDRAAQLIDRDMKRIRDCLNAGQWPCYGTEMHALALPAWALIGD